MSCSSNQKLGIPPGKMPLALSVIWDRHMVGAINSWHPTTIHCFLVWVLTASFDLELGIDPGIATSTGPGVCWDSIKG